VCQTVLDGFWDTTFAFGMLVRRYTEYCIDMLAGRVWGRQDYRFLLGLHTARTLAQSNQAYFEE